MQRGQWTPRESAAWLVTCARAGNCIVEKAIVSRTGDYLSLLLSASPPPVGSLLDRLISVSRSPATPLPQSAALANVASRNETLRRRHCEEKREREKERSILRASVGGEARISAGEIWGNLIATSPSLYRGRRRIYQYPLSSFIRKL